MPRKPQPLTCEFCHETKVRLVRASARGRDAGRFCSRACGFAAKKAAAAKAAAERAEAGEAARRSRCQPCRVCGALCQQPTHRLCSDDCRMEDARRQDRARNEARKPLLRRRCRECDGAYVPAYGDKRRTFCSDACALKHGKRISKRVRRARLRGVVAERVNPMAVFARDGWVCRLCGCRTPRAARGTTQPNAPELDHIVPLACGGAHTYENTQCACRRCNQAKGARPMGQLRLVG